MKTLLSLLIIAGVVFAFITIHKLEGFPEGNCCKDIKNATSTVCHSCDYSLLEKIIYVWKFPE